MAGISRLERAAILEQLSHEYVLNPARAKEPAPCGVVLVHILPHRWPAR